MMDNLGNIEQFANIIQAPVYWINRQGVVLGANKAAADALGCDSITNMVGKKINEIFLGEEQVNILNKICEQIYKTGKEYKHTELIAHHKTKQLHCFKSIKSPLRDSDNQVIGFINVSIELTSIESGSVIYSQTKRATMVKYLELLAATLPINLYWEDVNSVVLGGNESILGSIGAQSIDTVLGKTLYEIYPYELADKIVQHNNKVIRTEKILSQEETITDITTGNVKHFIAIKAPLRDDDGNIIGIVGTSTEITAEKEAQHLKLENEAYKVAAQEQEKFMKIANQVAHDIRSPLASLLMISKSCVGIPEPERIALREAITSIGDITNHLLSRYTINNTDAENSVIEKSLPILVSATILQLLSEKKYEYQKFPIKLEYDSSQMGYFSFIKIDNSSFKRMLSNLINNAKDAFDSFEMNNPKIIFRLSSNKELVTINIEDNGKGMSSQLIEKIKQNIPFSVGKNHGHGIGLTQVKETLSNYQGEMEVQSVVGKGTQIRLTFPRIKAPAWICEEIQLGNHDIIVILDDDASIHTAWNTCFESILQQPNTIEIKHFNEGNAALNFLNNMSSHEKAKVLLLTDYELLKQDLNGLDVIERSQVKRSLLVTSHYMDLNLQNQAIKVSTKILPKQLASEVQIRIDENLSLEMEPEKVDLVIVDDDKVYTENLVTFVLFDKVIAYYNDPKIFLSNLSSYSKNTKIFLDNYFNNYVKNGLELAEELHKMGYKNLYLLSGKIFSKAELPDYLISILKDEIDKIKELTQSS